MLNLKEYIQNNKGFAYRRALKEFHYQLLKDAMELTNGNKKDAIELLGMNNSTFYRYFDSTGLRDEH